ncbi:MAG: AMP-binding protein [Chloroflexi bacterium]|nr:AMP-binding protein [Chloroflexota bacterium]
MAQTLAEFLATSAQRFGARQALLFKPGFRYRQWTYSQLWDATGRVASLLQSRGLKKGDCVLLWAPNCPQWVLTFFGCMRAGVIVVPLDLRSTLDFAQRVASRTRPRLAFVSRMTPQVHQQIEVPRVYLEEVEELCEGLPPAREEDVAASDVAEVMFTSGTTGDPKGVMITHSNLVSNVEAASQHIPGKPSYRLLSILPLSHMFEQMGGLLMPLRCGANVTYPTSRQPAVLFRTLRERRITTMLLVPQALDLFMKSVEREVKRQGKERVWSLMLRIARSTPFPLRRHLFWQVHRGFGGCLDFVISGGAALDPELGARWELLGVRVIQGYGATEASPVISCHTLRRPRFDSAGKPLPGVEVRVAEDGEVLVQGPNITPGYWEAPEQTAAAFQDGWYRTGDLGSLDQDGFLHLKGRKKDMIALADGQKVFPEDIEAVLQKHPKLSDAVVVGLPRGSAVQVHAVFLPQDQEAAPEIVAWANRQLADHQQIHGFTVWGEQDFPRTHTLKVKKGVVVDVLLGAAPRAPAAIHAAQDPHPEASSSLQRIVAEVSGVPPREVTPEKTLGNDLHLDSLKRVELLSVIEGELGASLDEAQVGPATTFGQLQEMASPGRHPPAAAPFPRWGMSLWCRMVRGTLQRACVFPLLALAYRLRVTGRENLPALRGPVLLAANHNLLLDNGLIIKATPLGIRRWLAIAADAEQFRNPLWAVLDPLVGNGFPFSKEGNLRASLDNLGRVLDEGWSVLLYPEGELTVGAAMRPFKSGIGLIAVEVRVPVVPLRLRVHRTGWPPPFPLVRRGDAEIRFGKPLSFSPQTSYLEAARAIEEAVKAL